MKHSNINRYNENAGGVSILLFVLLALLLMYSLFTSVLGFVKVAREKIANVVEEVCPKCDGIIKFIGGTDYDIKINIEVETEIENITLGGNEIRFEKNNYNGSNSGSINYLDNEFNLNKGYDYLYDKAQNKFYFGEEWYSLNDFKSKLLESDKFNFDFSRLNEEEVEKLNDLDICFKDMIIDLGNHKIVRTYNFKFKSYIYVVSFEDDVIVVDTNIAPTAYYGDELYANKTLFAFEALGEEVLDLQVELFDKIKFIDLDGKIKTPNISIIEVEGYDLIDDDNKFYWFNENLTEDYSVSLLVSYEDLMGNLYEEKVVGVLFTQLSVPNFKDLKSYYSFKIGEYERPMPTDIICSITNESLIDTLVVDESLLNVNEVGRYRVVYSVKSVLSNILQKKVVMINIVE